MFDEEISITATPESIEFLKQKGSKEVALMLTKVGVGGCCSDKSATVAEVTFKAPKLTEYYQVTEIEGIQFYIPKRLPTINGKLNFVIEKTLFSKLLKAEGVNLPGN